MGFTAAVKNVLPRSLLGRSLLIIVMPLLLLQVVTASVFYESHWDRVTRRLVHTFVGDIAAVIDLLETYPGPVNRRLILDTASRNMAINVILDEGARLDAAEPRAEGGMLRTTLIESLRNLKMPFALDLDSEEVRIRLQLPEGLLTVVAARKRVDSSTTYVVTLWMVGSSLLLFGLATIFMRNQVRSVRRLAAAADSFGKGREVADFKPEGASEVRQAAVAFNMMRERIQRQVQQRTEMLAGVSHDLRTPLTRMKLQLAMMGEVDGVAELREDVAEMERMIEGYLAFARGEGGEKIRPADLTALVEDVVGRFRREGAAIDLHCEEELVLPLKPHAFDRCLSNLIGNACRYAGHISVRAGRRGDAAEIIIDDNGPGIPADKRDEVFKAFVRLDASRNVKTGGVGLGLTIARDVVRAHGGEIRLEDSPLGGLRVRLRLPV